MSRRSRMVALLLSVALAAPSVAWAAEPSLAELSADERAELGRLFTAAQGAFESEEYAQAIAKLERAYEIFPEPNILYRIGDAYEQQGDLEEAVAYYQRYVEAAPDASDAELVRRRIGDLEQILASRRSGDDASAEESAPESAASKLAVLIVDSNPAGARVRIGDEAEPRGVTPVRLRIEPGDVQIRLEADHHRPIERVLRVEAGETLSMVYPLQPVAPADDSIAWPWIVGGVGATALATGGGFLIASQSAQSQLDTYDARRLAAYRNDEPVPERPSDYDELTRESYYYGRTGWILTSVGIVGVGAGLTLWLMEDDEVALVPGVGGATLMGRF
ncbi:tetratricopeptide repeat protein [Persicimonas caeni]|nr:tetratricopeptide repeat protein [Persicimonas caeni]